MGAVWVFSTLPPDARLVYTLTPREGTNIEELQRILQENVEAILAQAAANTIASNQSEYKPNRICVAPITISFIVTSQGFEEAEIRRILESASSESLFWPYDASVCLYNLDSVTDIIPTSAPTPAPTRASRPQCLVACLKNYNNARQLCYEGAALFSLDKVTCLVAARTKKRECITQALIEKGC